MENPAQEIWNFYSGPQNRSRRRKLWRDFRKDQITASDQGLRNFIQFLCQKQNRQLLSGDDRYQNLDTFHHRAYPILIQYGQAYQPTIRHQLPGYLPKPGNCAFYSKHLVDISYEKGGRAVYVEGMVCGQFARPMLHAWVAKKGMEDTKAIDFTQCVGTQWSRYWGIPFSREEYEWLCSLIYKKKRMTLLFHPRILPRIENELISLLKSRT